MNLPARYPYDPRWQIVAIPWACAAALAIASFVPGAYAPRARGIVLGLLAVFVILGLLIALRRYAFPRHLLIDEEGIWLPSGFLRLDVRRVAFAEISDVWEAFIPCTVALCLRSQGRTYEVISTLLPDHGTYLAVAGYIDSRVAAPGA
jgi:hypothetical protein